MLARLAHSFLARSSHSRSSDRPCSRGPGPAPALREFLDRMRFMLRVEVEDCSVGHSVLWLPAGAAVPASAVALWRYPRAELGEFAGTEVLLAGPMPTSGPVAGVWAHE